MKKNQIQQMPFYFDRYIDLVPDVELLNAMATFGDSFLNQEKNNFNLLENKVYQTGKWTINDILQHIIDTERILSYRALRFARKDKTLLPGFDENQFAETAHASNRQLNSLLDEFRFVRNSTIEMYKSFEVEDLMQSGSSGNSEISVIALGFTITGHVIHHMKVINDRYYPLLQS